VLQGLWVLVMELHPRKKKKLIKATLEDAKEKEEDP
jgi:hypothetical protein